MWGRSLARCCGPTSTREATSCSRGTSAHPADTKSPPACRSQLTWLDQHRVDTPEAPGCAGGVRKGQGGEVLDPSRSSPDAMSKRRDIFLEFPRTRVLGDFSKKSNPRNFFRKFSAMATGAWRRHWPLPEAGAGVFLPLSGRERECSIQMVLECRSVKDGTWTKTESDAGGAQAVARCCPLATLTWGWRGADLQHDFLAPLATHRCCLKMLVLGWCHTVPWGLRSAPDPASDQFGRVCSTTQCCQACSRGNSEARHGLA